MSRHPLVLGDPPKELPVLPIQFLLFVAGSGRRDVVERGLAVKTLEDKSEEPGCSAGIRWLVGILSVRHNSVPAIIAEPHAWRERRAVTHPWALGGAKNADGAACFPRGHQGNPALVGVRDPVNDAIPIVLVRALRLGVRIMALAPSHAVPEMGHTGEARAPWKYAMYCEMYHCPI